MIPLFVLAAAWSMSAFAMPGSPPAKGSRPPSRSINSVDIETAVTVVPRDDNHWYPMTAQDKCSYDIPYQYNYVHPPKDDCKAILDYYTSNTGEFHFWKGDLQKLTSLMVSGDCGFYVFWEPDSVKSPNNDQDYGVRIGNTDIAEMVQYSFDSPNDAGDIGLVGMLHCESINAVSSGNIGDIDLQWWVLRPDQVDQAYAAVTAPAPTTPPPSTST
ncbi:hypothetical protein F4819DRAFT_480471 [Hypoxylon fuscum]|nr:hypothetical protein F4819DRAFT_480471 [Hypoxylon fuscum]